MSSTPDNPWLGQGSSQWLEQPPESRRPLYFLVFAAEVLFLTLMAVFYIKVVRDGRDVADPDKDPKATSTTVGAPSTVKATMLNANGSLEEAREAAPQLREKSSCTAKNDAKSLAVFIQAAKKEDKLNKERKLAMSTLAALSKNCGAEYTIDLMKQMKKNTSEVSDLVSDRSWWHLASPAPSGTKDVTESTTGKHNIRCKLDDDDESVSRSIYIYDYPSPDGCENKTATYHLSQTKEATTDCNLALSSSIQVVYGSTVSHNGIWYPISQEQGITCTSELSGKGFQLKQAAARLF